MEALQSLAVARTTQQRAALFQWRERVFYKRDDLNPDPQQSGVVMCACMQREGCRQADPEAKQQASGSARDSISR